MFKRLDALVVVVSAVELAHAHTSKAKRVNHRTILAKLLKLRHDFLLTRAACQ